MGKAKLLLEIILPIIGLIALIGFALQYTDLQNEKLERLNQEVVETTLNYLDICVNTKSLNDIANCDKEIPENISKVCKDNDIGGCESRIAEYYNTRDTRVDLAHTALNSAILNLIETCSNNVGPSCEDSLNEIKNYCQTYRNSIAYVAACNELSTNPTSFPVDTGINLSSLIERHLDTCQTIYNEYQEMQKESDLVYLNYAIEAKGKIDACLMESDRIEILCAQEYDCKYATLHELKSNLEEAKNDIDNTVAMMHNYP